MSKSHRAQNSAPSPKAEQSSDRLGLLQRCLADHDSSWQPIDRSLELDGRQLADLVLRDGEDLLFVLDAVRGADALCLMILDLLSFEACHGQLLRQHLGVTGGGGLGLILVGTDFGARLLDRLQVFSGVRLELLRLVELGSGRCTGPVLLPLAVEGEGTADAVVEPEEEEEAEQLGTEPEVILQPRRAPLPSAARAFLAAGPSARSEYASDLIQRIVRLDDHLDLSGGSAGLNWSFEGQLLCRLEWQGQELAGKLPGDGPSHGLGSAADVDLFLDWVLALHLECVDAAEEEALTPFELTPAPQDHFLTPEEIEAFRE